MLGLELPAEWRSGLGDLGPGDPIGATIACEEIAWASAALGNIVSAIRITAFALDRFGGDAVKRQWLPPLLRGECTIGFAVTEPEAGSDLASLATTARRDGDCYVLDGAKWPITFAPIADAFMVLCTLDRSLGTRGMAVLMVERDRPGVTIGPPERKLGQLGNPLGGVTFEGVRVPRENLLGEEGQGFKIAMASLDVTRIDVASIALGLSRAALDAARTHALARIQFGKPIADLQAVQFMLAEMATEIEAGQWLTWRAATVRGQGVRFTREAAMAKALLQRQLHEAHDERHPDPRRPRLSEGLRRRTLLPRRQGDSDLRRRQRDPESRHRPPRPGRGRWAQPAKRHHASFAPSSPRSPPHSAARPPESSRSD